MVIGWTLSPVAGPQRLSVAAAGVADPLEVAATATPGAASKISLMTLPGSAPAGRPVGRSVGALVVDRFGNPVAGALVTFRVTAGKVAPGRVRTGTNGQAAARWVLGPKPGTQRVEAGVAGVAARAAGTIKAVR
jgi:hypothetical protein